MINAHIDLGQLIIAILIALLGIIAWFIRKEITEFGLRLDKHETMLFRMTQNVSIVMGQVGILMQLFARRKDDTGKIMAILDEKE